MTARALIAADESMPPECVSGALRVCSPHEQREVARRGGQPAPNTVAARRGGSDRTQREGGGTTRKARPSATRARALGARDIRKPADEGMNQLRGALFYIIGLARRTLGALTTYYVNRREIDPPETSRSPQSARRGAARVEVPKRARASERAAKAPACSRCYCTRAERHERARISEGGPPIPEERAPNSAFGCAFL